MIFSPTAYIVLSLVAAVSFLLTIPLSLGEGSVSRLSLASAEDLAQAGVKSAGKIRCLAENRRQVLYNLRSARSFVVTAALGCVTLLASQMRLRWWLVALVVIAVGALALVAVTLPWNTLGRRYPNTVVRYLAEFLYTVWRAGLPLERIWKTARGPLARTDQEARDEAADDLREMVDQIGEPHTIEEADREMIWSVFEMGRTLVREVMVPRVDMVTVEADTTLDKALALFVRSGYSRVPVIGDDADDVRGVLYLKDVLRRVLADPTGSARKMLTEQAMREARFIPETNLVGDALRDMQENRHHLALLVDEYGLIAGLITLEDLVEEVIGEVSDEHDHSEIEPQLQRDGSWLVPARFPLVDLNDLMNLEIEDEDVDTVGGLLTKAIGMVPLVGSQAETLGLNLQAVEAGGRRRQVSLISVKEISPVADEDN